MLTTRSTSAPPRFIAPARVAAISWCLWNLAHHEDYQEQCRQEVNDVLGDKEDVAWLVRDALAPAADARTAGGRARVAASP